MAIFISEVKFYNMRFLLIYPTTDTYPFYGGEKEFLYAPPLGLLYLSSVLTQLDCKAKVIDIRGEENAMEKIERSIHSSDAIGITVPTFALHNSKKLIEKIREMDGSIPIIIGGPHPTLYPQKCLVDLAADMAVEGEGERSIEDITKILEGKLKAENGKGIYFRGDGRIKCGRKTEIIKDIDSIPFPSHNLVSEYDYGYSYGFKLFKGKTTAILTSRGCPRKCRFCSRNTLSMKTYRVRSAENVVKEIEMLSHDGYKNVIVVDDNFTTSIKRVEKIMDAVVERGIDLTFMVNGARVDSANEAVYKKMWRAGVRMISFGIESGSQKILDFYRKEITLEQIRKAVELSSRIGFFTVGTFILGAPAETPEDIKATIEFARSLPLDMAEFFILHYMPGSELWEEAKAAGKIGDDEYIVESDASRGLALLGRKELLEWKKKAYNKFYFRPSYILREIFRFISRFDIRILTAGFSMLRILLYRLEKEERVWEELGG